MTQQARNFIVDLGDRVEQPGSPHEQRIDVAGFTKARDISACGSAQSTAQP